MRTRYISLAGVVLALVGYSLPWITSSGSALQPNAYDLAEWLTLIPAVRTNTPFLLPALLLRLPLLLIGVVLIMTGDEQPVWVAVLRWAVVAGILIALLPPVDFFRGAWRDPNYQQQFVLWVVYALALATMPAYPVLRWGVVIAAIVCGIAGLVWGYTLFSRYEAPLHVGPGGVVYVLGWFGYALGHFKAGRGTLPAMRPN